MMVGGYMDIVDSDLLYLSLRFQCDCIFAFFLVELHICIGLREYHGPLIRGTGQVSIEKFEPNLKRKDWPRLTICLECKEKCSYLDQNKSKEKCFKDPIQCWPFLWPPLPFSVHPLLIYFLK